MPLPLLSDRELDDILALYPELRICPTCLGAKEYKLDGQTYLCDCRHQLQLARHYAKAGIGSMYQTACWDDFTSVDRDVLVPYLQRYVETFSWQLRYGLGFILSSIGLGTGKTLVMSLVMKDLVKAGFRCHFVTAKSLVNSRSKTTDDDEYISASLMRRVEVLGIDDLGSGMSSQQRTYFEDAFESIIRDRYNHSLPTLVTTNLTPDKQEEYYPRVFSVLTGLNEQIELQSTEDARATSHKRRLKDLALNEETLPID